MDHTEVGLEATIRSLSDVVAPVIDPGSALAREQLNLAIDYLGFVVGRVSYLHERHRFEFEHHLEMAQALLHLSEDNGHDAWTELCAAVEGAERVKGLGSKFDCAIRAETEKLAAAISGMVRAAGDFGPDTRRNVHRCVVSFSSNRVAFERAWYAPLGFDPDPSTVQALEDFLPRDQSEPKKR